jgi:flagellar basal body rod protein FlgG
MIKGLYRSASGMLPQIKKQEVVANNIANAGTAGYKKDVMFSRELSQAERKITPRTNDWQTTLDSRIKIDYGLGVFDKTDNPLDLAIEGDGFFALQAGDGTTALTRSGAFVVDADGFLSMSGGYRLVGDGGPIQVGSGKLSVGQNGEVQVNGLSAGRVAVKTVADVTTLERLGGSLFGVPEGQELIDPLQATIRQGYRETSNVDVIQEMVDMMVAFRTYESNARALQTQDASLNHLFQRVGGDR